MISEPPPNLIVEKPLNIIGKYRICEDPDCPKYIPCPFVMCQEHRKDMAKKESTVRAYGE